MQESNSVDLTTLFKKKPTDCSECEETIKMVVDLTQTTSESYPEIDYKLELLKKTKEKQRNLIPDDDDVKDTVAKLEAKYGNKTEKFKPKYSILDFNSNDSDSFIDNSEAFDEHIPDGISTLYGGFHVNVGPVTFKKDDQKDDEVYTGVKKYTCVLKPKDRLVKELNQQLFTLKRGKLCVENKKKFIKKIRTNKIETGIDKLTEDINAEQRKSELPTTSFNGVLESLTDNNNEENDRSSKDMTISPEAGQSCTILHHEVELPKNIPPDVTDIIENIKIAASGSKINSKELVNKLLLEFECKCELLDKATKIKVYDYLAPFFKCKRKSLIKRAKNVYVNEENKKVHKLLQKLKNAVTQQTIKLVSEEAYEDKTPTLFLWNDEVKELLQNVMNLQKHCFQLEGNKKFTVEMRLERFVEFDLLPIWPNGWMSTSKLLDYYDSISDLTIPLDQDIANFPV